MEETEQILLSKNTKILFNFIEIRLFDLSQVLQVGGHKLSINQVKQTLEKQYNIFGQIEKIFHQLKLHKLYDLIKQVSQNYISIASILIDSIAKSQNSNNYRQNGKNSQKKQLKPKSQVGEKSIQRVRNSPRQFSQNKSANKNQETTKFSSQINKAFKNIKAHQFQLKNKLAGIHLFNENYKRGVQTLEQKQQSWEQKKRKKYGQKQLILQLISKEITDQVDVEKLHDNDEISKFIREGKIKHQLYNHIEYEKDLQSISTFLKQSQDDALKFLTQTKKIKQDPETKNSDDEIVVNYHELIEMLVERKKTEYKTLENKIKQIVEAFKSKFDKMENDLQIKEANIREFEYKLKAKQGQEVGSQTVGLKSRFNIKNSPDVIEQLEQQHKTVVQLLKKNLDENQKEILSLEADVRITDEKLKKKEQQIIDLATQIQKLKKQLKQQKQKPSTPKATDLDTKNNQQSQNVISPTNEVGDAQMNEPQQIRVSPQKKSKQKHTYFGGNYANNLNFASKLVVNQESGFSTPQIEIRQNDEKQKRTALPLMSGNIQYQNNSFDEKVNNQIQQTQKWKSEERINQNTKQYNQIAQEEKYIISSPNNQNFKKQKILSYNNQKQLISQQKVRKISQQQQHFQNYQSNKQKQNVSNLNVSKDQQHQYNENQFSYQVKNNQTKNNQGKGYQGKVNEGKGKVNEGKDKTNEGKGYESKSYEEKSKGRKDYQGKNNEGKITEEKSNQEGKDYEMKSNEGGKGYERKSNEGKKGLNNSIEPIDRRVEKEKSFEKDIQQSSKEKFRKNEYRRISTTPKNQQEFQKQNDQKTIEDKLFKIQHQDAVDMNEVKRPQNSQELLQNNTSKVYQLLFKSNQDVGKQIQRQNQILQLSNFIQKYNQDLLYARLRKIFTILKTFSNYKNQIQPIIENEDSEQEDILSSGKISQNLQNVKLSNLNLDKLKYPKENSYNNMRRQILANIRANTETEKYEKQQAVKFYKNKKIQNLTKNITASLLKKIHNQLRISGKGFDFSKKQFLQICKNITLDESILNSSNASDSSDSQQQREPKYLNPAKNAFNYPMINSTKNIKEKPIKEEKQLKKIQQEELKIKEGGKIDIKKGINKTFLHHSRKQSQSMRNLWKPENISQQPEAQNLIKIQKLQNIQKDNSRYELESINQNKQNQNTQEFKIEKKKLLQKFYQALKDQGTKIQSIAKLQEIIQANKISLKDINKISALIGNQKSKNFSQILNQDCNQFCRVLNGSGGCSSKSCCNHIKKYSLFLERLLLNEQSLRRIKKEVFVMHILNIDGNQESNGNTYKKKFLNQKSSAKMNLTCNNSDAMLKAIQNQTFYVSSKKNDQIAMSRQALKKTALSIHFEPKQRKFNFQTKNKPKNVDCVSFLPQLANKPPSQSMEN